MNKVQINEDQLTPGQRAILEDLQNLPKAPCPYCKRPHDTPKDDAHVALPDSKENLAMKVLESKGVFKGAEGLNGLAECQEFWDEKPYGKRLYYGTGGMDYLHRDVLRAAVRALAENPAPSETEKLREQAKVLTTISPDLVDEVATMPMPELQRRYLNAVDYNGLHSRSLDGIPQINGIPGDTFDGCRSHRETRRIVLHLVDRLETLKAENERLREALEMNLEGNRDAIRLISRTPFNSGYQEKCVAKAESALNPGQQKDPA